MNLHTILLHAALAAMLMAVLWSRLAMQWRWLAARDIDAQRAVVGRTVLVLALLR